MLPLASSYPAGCSINSPRESAFSRLVFLLAFGILACGAIARAQTPPTLLNIYEDPFGVSIRYAHCESSEYQNCYTNFGLYRSTSPSTNFSKIGTCWASSNSATDICQDGTVKVGQTYTYRLCAGGAALNDLSNCATAPNPFTVVKSAPLPAPTVTLAAGSSSVPKGGNTSLTWNSTNATSLDLEPGIGKVGPSGSIQVNLMQTTTYTLTATGNGYTEKATATINVACLTQWSPPANLSALSGLSDVPLKWTNPVTNPNGTCPAPPTQVLIYRSGPNGMQQIAALPKIGNTGTLPSHYTDSSLLQPHTAYAYEVCEGGPPNWQNPTNCASPAGALHSIVTWGADPVLYATRDGANSVKLQIALDQYSVTSVLVTRQGSDDPCRQGGTLANGLQGCKTVGAYGGSPAQTVTVYNWTQSSDSQYPPGFQNSQSAPFVINLPDDTSVKPGVEYYYMAQVTWLSTIGQQSNTVTVPNAYSSATLQHGIGTGVLVKSLGNAPPPSPQSSAAPASAVPHGSYAAASASSSPVATAPPVTKVPASPAVTPPTTAMRSTSMMASTATAATPLLQSAAGTASVPLLAQTGAATTASLAQPAPVTGGLAEAIKQVQQKPHDALTLYSLGKAYCATNGKNTGVSYMYMAFLLAQQSSNAPLVAQIKASLAQQGVNPR